MTKREKLTFGWKLEKTLLKNVINNLSLSVLQSSHFHAAYLMQATRNNPTEVMDDACTFLLLFRISLSHSLLAKPVHHIVDESASISCQSAELLLAARRFERRDSIAITLLNYHYYCSNTRDSLVSASRESWVSRLPESSSAFCQPPQLPNSRAFLTFSRLLLHRERERYVLNEWIRCTMSTQSHSHPEKKEH